MRWPSTFQSFVRSIFRRQQSERDLDSELQDHLHQEIESGIRAGMSLEEATFAAQRLIGSLSLYKEECRDARGIGFVETSMRDLRYAVRTLRRTPLFTAVAIITLALGIGANTTVFTFIENIVLRSLPVHNPEELTELNWGGGVNFSYPNYLDLRDRNTVFSSLAAYRFYPASIGVHARNSFRVWGYQATGNYFETLGVKPLLGRFFGPAEDDRTGAHPVLIITHRLWQSRFGADPNIIGRVVKINAYPFTVIGVAPPGFSGTELVVSGDYWIPLSMEPRIEPDDVLRYRTSQNLWLMGRLRPAVTRARAEANLNQIAHEIAHAYPHDVDPKAKFQLSRPGLLGDVLRGPITKFGVVLIGIAGVGLLLACANLAGMLLARASDRNREMGIRLAVGASRLQLLRQLFTESLLLALSGGLLGLCIAFGTCDLVSAWHPAFDLPISTALQPDATVLCSALLMALGTTLLFGLTPALQAVRTDLIPSLKNEPVSSAFRRWSARDLLVAAQIALSVILVISSVLVVRSLQHALSLNLGFNPDGAASVSFDLSTRGYDDKGSRRVDASLLAKASAIPGLESVGVVSTLPLRMGGNDGEFISRTDRPVPAPSERHVAMIYNISPGYLRAAGTRLLAGRDIDGRDHDGVQRTAIVNDAVCHLLFGDDNPLGKRFRISLDAADSGIEIVGVVETGKYQSLGEDPRPAVFLPIAQTGTAWTTLVARSRLPVSVTAEMLRKAALDLDPELTLFSSGSLREQLALPLFPARIAAIVLGVFGTLAMVLAATGLFALMSYAVSRRTREIGIRMALGAQPRQILFSVLRRTLILCAIGISVGTLITLAAGRMLGAVLYGISPHDPATYLTSLLLLGMVALLACWNPATRAIRIDPALTLRAD
jgi:predicted permease